jgi:predicted deacylase
LDCFGDGDRTFLRGAWFPSVDDRGHWEEMAQVAAVFDAPFIVVGGEGGSLAQQAADRYKTVVGGWFPPDHPDSVHCAVEGARNVMKYYGMIDGDLVRLEPERRAKPRVVAMAPPLCSPIGGRFEPGISLGSPHQPGQTFGSVHFAGSPTPSPIRTTQSGWLIGVKNAGDVRQGDPLAWSARPLVKR